MDTKNFMTMTVGLIVGVLLIAGVVTPVIANVSSDEGGSGSGGSATTLRNDTGEVNLYFTKPTSTDIVIDCIGFDDEQYVATFSSVVGGVVKQWIGYEAVVGEDWVIGYQIMADLNDNELYGFEYAVNDTIYFTTELTISGSTVSFTPYESENEVVTVEGVLFHSWYEGDYVMDYSDTPPVIYLSDDSEIWMWTSDKFAGTGMHVFISGTPNNNHTFARGWNPSDVLETLSPAVFTISGAHILESISFSYDDTDFSLSFTQSPYIGEIIVPVEVTVSGSSYTNTGGETYLHTDSSTSVTYYLYDSNSTRWCIEPSSVADRESYNGRINFITDTGTFHAIILSVPAKFSLSVNESNYRTEELSVDGDVLSFTDIDSNEVISISGIRYITYPDGDCVNTVVGTLMSQEIESRYAFEDTPLACMLYINDMGCELLVTGTAKSNTVSLMFDGSVPIESIGPSADIDVADDQISSITVTVNGTEYTCDLEVPATERAVEINGCILPVTVTDAGSGGGSGLSPTLTTILSVIPLVLTVGLVIGAIGYLRFKE